MDDADRQKYEEYLAMLHDHLATCERENNFAEAANTKQRIEDLKIQEGQRQLEQMLLRQQQERMQVEESQMNDLNNFQQQWDMRLQQRDQENQQAIQQLEERHTQELETHR